VAATVVLAAIVAVLGGLETVFATLVVFISGIGLAVGSVISIVVTGAVVRGSVSIGIGVMVTDGSKVVLIVSSSGVGVLKNQKGADDTSGIGVSVPFGTISELQALKSKQNKSSRIKRFRI
jgi:hypothetical protein